MSESTSHRRFSDGYLWTLDYPTAVAAARLLTRSPAAADAQVVVAVARGGLWPAATIAAYLGLPMISVAARHNTGEGIRLQATGDAVVSCPVDPAFLADASALIVDDIHGTGTTLHAVRDSVPHLGSAPAVALCRNTGAGSAPQAWVWDVSDWVRFPWEDPPPADARTRPLFLPDVPHTSRRLA